MKEYANLINENVTPGISPGTINKFKNVNILKNSRK